jgi:hypothetical protein
VRVSSKSLLYSPILFFFVDGGSVLYTCANLILNYEWREHSDTLMFAQRLSSLLEYIRPWKSPLNSAGSHLFRVLIHNSLSFLYNFHTFISFPFLSVIRKSIKLHFVFQKAHFRTCICKVSKDIKISLYLAN